ncbi:hypothetical protein [Mammaliicoccus sciuri]|uniref:hypothetical protein n=1 Tax=Mammaliicoccus sciuri TaxID=1296 RepID=UPI002DBBEE88|nr:hypothetical protein [Mammaliicoccus sciuri]MEB6196917.1 hypothetical protein [Mammaliicoccus sciuri]
MKKKLYSIIAVGVLSLTITPHITNAESYESKEVDNQITQGFIPNLEEAFNESYNNNSNIIQESYGLKVPVSSIFIKKLAQGKSSLSKKGTKITSTGTTKGKKLTTITSATTGIGLAKGKKSTSGAYGTAKSTASMKKKKGKKQYGSVTIHTATNNGALYKGRSGVKKSY